MTCGYHYWQIQTIVRPCVRSYNTPSLNISAAQLRTIKTISKILYFHKKFPSSFKLKFFLRNSFLIKILFYVIRFYTRIILIRNKLYFNHAKSSCCRRSRGKYRSIVHEIFGIGTLERTSINRSLISTHLSENSIIYIDMLETCPRVAYGGVLWK